MIYSRLEAQIRAPRRRYQLVKTIKSAVNVE